MARVLVSTVIDAPIAQVWDIRSGRGRHRSASPRVRVRRGGDHGRVVNATDRQAVFVEIELKR